MNYLLVDSAKLAEKGLYPNAEKLPDGRSILAMNAMRVLSGISVTIESEEHVLKLKNAKLEPTPEVLQENEGGTEVEVVNEEMEVTDEQS